MRVQVHIRAEKLRNISRGRWIGKRSNPYAKVSFVAGRNGTNEHFSPVEVGCTEVIYDTLNPEWASILVIEYNEVEQWTPLTIAIYDSRDSQVKSDSHPHDSSRSLSSNPQPRTVEPHQSGTKKDRKMGEVNVEVGEILKMSGQEVKLDLNEGGSIFVHITESVRGNDNGLFLGHIRGLDLKNIESGLLGLGAIDPYFEISKKYTDTNSGLSRWHVVYRSEVVPDIINPYWDPFQIEMEHLCHNNLDQELKISIWDEEDRGENRCLGDVEVNVRELQQHVTKGGNANRGLALRVEDLNHEIIGLLVVLRAEII